MLRQTRMLSRVAMAASGGVTVAAPGRTSVQGMVPAGGHEMHGRTRGPVCTVPEPEEAWLHVLGAALPFNGIAGLVTLDDATVSNNIVARAQAHFKHVIPAPLTRSAAPPMPSNARGRATTPSSQEHSESALQQLVTRNPYGHIPVGELDVLCYTGRSFASVLPWVAHHVTEASSRLKPHGVLSVLCQRKARLIGPETLVEDWDDMVQHLSDNFGDESTLAEEIGFEFVSFPHLHVRRRWLTSEYPLTTSRLEAYVRSWPEYHRCAAPKHTTTASAVGDGDADGEGDVVLGRMAFPAEGDPLEAFLLAADAYLAKTQAPGTRLGDVCRLSVDHCVITCDNRPSNRPLQVDMRDLGRTLCDNVGLPPHRKQ